jgi:hypothetical protein
MTVAGQIGTLADVRDARRALNAKFEPPFGFYLAWAAGFAICVGSDSLPLALVGAGVLPAASVAAAWWQSRRARFIFPRRLRLFSRRVFVLTSLLSLIAMLVVLAIAGMVAAALLHRWTWVAALWHRGTLIAYLVPFVVFIVPVSAALTLPWRIEPYGVDARPMRKTPDRPVALDPMISPRQQTIVCAMLAGLDCIEAEFVAEMLRVTDEELRRQTAELLAAQYIAVHPHDGRWWFGLTAVGRASYRRHLRALQRVASEQPTVDADEPL